ncbi:MAG TPA: hypothetical protein VM261_22450 [Kofleriaceae bacterium]|nr:hypothetical protein [Kofleriaceae bacterium]
MNEPQASTPIESPFPSALPAPATLASSGAWGPLQPPWAACRRDGELLVCPRECMLPPHCVKCGAPASERHTAKLYWHPPGWYALLLLSLWGYLIAALLVRKKAVLEVGLCDRHARRRRRGRMTGWMIVLGGVAVMFTGDPIVILAGIVAVLTGLLVASAMGRLAVARRIDDCYVWVRGVHASILRALPPLY